MTTHSSILAQRAWQDAVHGITKSQTPLKRLSSHADGESTVVAVRTMFHRNLQRQVHEASKLDTVKQEMARLNISILGISELKWTEMCEFDSDGHYIYYCGQEFLRRNGVALIVNKSPKCSICLQSQKCHNDLGSFPRQTIQHHNNANLCSNHQCQRN